MIGSQQGMAQADIDAAQGAFAEAVGDKDLARTNYREAGFNDRGSDGDRYKSRWFRSDKYVGNAVTDAEKDGARAQLGQVLSAQGQMGQLPIGNMVGALIAGPNAGAVQLGAAMGMVGGVQNAVNNFAFALMVLMTENARDAAQGNGEGQSNVQRGGGAPSAASAPADGTIDLPVSTSSSGGESILMKIAKALGAAMDEKMEKMAETSDAIGKLDDDDNKGYGQLTAELTALGQELKMLTEALNNSLKSIGESGSILARKQ